MQPNNQPPVAPRDNQPDAAPAANPTEPASRYQAEPESRQVPMVAIDPLATMQGQPEKSALPGNGDTRGPKAGTVAAQAPGQTIIEWTAKEYIAPKKNTGWYIILALLVLLVIAADIWLLKSTFTVSILAITIAVALVVMSVRPARTIAYAITDTGLMADKQFLQFSDYKAFGLVHDGKEHSIMLIPLKSWLPGYSIYFPADKGEAIVDALAQKLPNQPVKLDIMDKIANALRL